MSSAERTRPDGEDAIAELPKKQGYAPACLGKWDVSNRAAIPERMPNAQGFDDLYGFLGANDSGRIGLHETKWDMVAIPPASGLSHIGYTHKSHAANELAVIPIENLAAE